jgi:hypothetical protein
VMIHVSLSTKYFTSRPKIPTALTENILDNYKRKRQQVTWQGTKPLLYIPANRGQYFTGTFVRACPQLHSHFREKRLSPQETL